MKLKDIKKSLKNEQAKVKIPDVFERAKRAPVNKLLTGETPVQAFKKRLVMRTLTMVLVLLLAVAITLSAMWLAPDRSPAASCYVRINVTSDGQTHTFAMVANGMIVGGYFEENGDGVKPKLMQISSISEFYQPKSNDKVAIYVACDDAQLQKKWSGKVESEIVEMYKNGMDYEEIRSVSSSATAKRMLVTLLNSLANDDRVGVSDGMDKLTSLYISLSVAD